MYSGIFLMIVSNRLTSPTMILVGLCLFFPFLADLHTPLVHGIAVKYIENIQALVLLLVAIFSFFYIRPDRCSDGKKQFWLWAIFWWILLFGRSTSWGRDYFPEVPKVYFRTLSVVFIAPVVVMLFSSALRQEIVNKFKTVQFPMWSFALAVIALLIADSIEHSRMILPVFLHDIAYKDFMEEMYEFPVIWGLFEVTFLLMKQEKEEMKSENQDLQSTETVDQEEYSACNNVH